MAKETIMKQRIWIGAALVAVLWAGPAGAFSFLDRAYGTPELGLSPRARAMGGAGTALGMGAWSLVDNPAGMVLSTGDEVVLNGWMARASENRFVPIYDTFDSYVDENAVAVNDNAYGGLEGGVLLNRAPDGKGFFLGAGLFNRYDPRYDYYDEIRSTASTDDLLARHYITTEGVLRTATAGAAWAPARGLGLGVAVNYYYGTFEHRSVLVATDAADFDSEESRLERKLDGVSFTVGATAKVSDRIQAAWAFESAPKLDDDYASWTNGTADEAEGTNGDLDFPSRLQAGLVYRPRNALRTTFVADAVYMLWSDVEDHLAPDQELEDTWEARFGVEHVFYNDLGGRIGFRYGDSYVTDEAARAAFTFGFGYAVDAIRLDVGGELAKRTSRQAPIRDRGTFGDRVGLGTDRVEDTLVRVTLGATWSF